MGTRARSFWLATLVVAASALAVASVAWACTGGDFGLPSTPAPPPTPHPTPSPASPAPVTPAPVSPGSGAGSGSPAGSPAGAGSTSGAGSPAAAGSTSGAGSSASSNTVSGARLLSAGQGAGGAARRSGSGSGSGAAGGSGATGGSGSAGASSFGSSALAVRVRGATAGVTYQGGHAVFASSTAPRTRARAHAARHPAHATAPSPRSATSDVWSGFGASAARSPVSAAAAASSSAQGGGLSSQVLIGMVILGLGLVGVLGGVLVTVARRRTAAASKSTRTGGRATER